MKARTLLPAASPEGLPGIDLSLPPEILEAGLATPAEAFSHPAYRDIIASDAFQRLRRICFLGAIDYLFHPNGSAACRRHTRFEHTLGVAHLALLYGRWTGLAERDCLHLVTAALLHDIGHAPLSHSLEPVLKRRFGIGHHDAGQAVLHGTAPVGRDLPRILSGHGIDADRVEALIDGTSSDPGAHLFSSPINIDTLDGIYRSYRYAVTSPAEPPPVRVLFAALRRDAGDIRIMDRFWELKGRIYHNLINGRAGALADYVARHYAEMLADDLAPQLWYWDEAQLRREHRALFHLLALVRNPAELAASVPDWPACIRITARGFRVDTTVPVPDPSNDARRYRQDKTPLELNTSLPNPASLDRTTAHPPLDKDGHVLGSPEKLRGTSLLF